MRQEYADTAESLTPDDVRELYGVYDDLFTAKLDGDWGMVSRQRQRMKDVLDIGTVEEIIEEEYANE